MQQNHREQDLGHPLDSFELDFYIENQLIDWINSFDDPHCVLVSKLPQDLSNGVILSHLVGNVVCTLNDR
jgi:hypothetical protein